MKKILVAEDEAAQQGIWRYLLERWGYAGRIAGNAEEAESLAVADPPDLLILDMRMPVSITGPSNEFAGLAALRAIRQHPGLAKIPALAMTAQPEYYLVEPGLPDEVFEVIVKPFDIPSLEQTIKQALESAPAP